MKIKYIIDKGEKWIVISMAGRECRYLLRQWNLAAAVEDFVQNQGYVNCIAEL